MENRPNYLQSLLFDWDLMNVIIGGKSALDSKFFLTTVKDMTEVHRFLEGYGINPKDPISQAELFGNFQEALQFIKRYFLKEGNPDGLDLKIPNRIFMITDVSDLFLLATERKDGGDDENVLWAEVILKVMHTVLHIDKDIRSNYFSATQTQIFDRYYKYIHRDSDQKLFLGKKRDDQGIPLVDFETKSKKSRDSVIIKLLHKAENVAEELFDRVGIRIITENRIDTLRVMKFLLEENVIIPHNIKPSRSINNLFDLEKFRPKYGKLIKMALRNDLSRERFLQAANRELLDCPISDGDAKNIHSSKGYQSLQFTCRQLIKFQNPFFKEFKELREEAKTLKDESAFAQKVLNIDYSILSKNIRFFYPYEVQIVDQMGHQINTEGEASHAEYKRSQVKAAMLRVFRPLLEAKNIDTNRL